MKTRYFYTNLKMKKKINFPFSIASDVVAFLSQ